MARGLSTSIAAGAALLALALGGCGEGPGPAEIGHASPGPITKQRVEEFARAVNLRADDLPGATSEASGPDRSASPRTEAQLKRCAPRVGSLKIVASADSPSFAYAEGGEAAFFNSSVQASQTGDELEALLREFAHPAGFACLARAIRTEVEEEATGEAHYLGFSASKLRKPLPLGVPAVGIRLHIPFEADLVEHDAYVDYFLFSAGHAEVGLEALGMPKPVSQDVEARLISTLVERAEDHAL